MSTLKIDLTDKNMCLEFLEEVKQRGLINTKNKKFCMYLNCIKQLPVLISAIIGYVTISSFALIVCISIGI